MNYNDLKTNIPAYLHRSDLSGMLDTFIDLFEARANREIRTIEMEQRSTSTPVDEYIAFPTDFLQLRNIQVNTNPKTPLEYRTPYQIDELGSYQGLPTVYTIVGNEFQIPGATGYEIEVSYIKKIPALSDTNLTNWLIDNYPDYYLSGCLQQAYIYMKDANNAAQLEQKLIMLENAIKQADMDKKYGSGPLVITT